MTTDQPVAPLAGAVGRRTVEFLQSRGLATSDADDGSPSPHAFPDGARYRIEQAGADTPGIIEGLIAGAKARGYVLHRLVDTRGIIRLTDTDIRDMCAMTAEQGIELFLSVGPRAVYDLSATRQTRGGGSLSYRLRGVRGLVWGMEDVYRAIELGVRGIMVYDEGQLALIDEMRSSGDIPEDIAVKVSAHVAAANPLSVRLLARNGAHSVNVARDLDIGMLSAIRRAVDIPLDIHTDAPQESGGFIRTYEVPDIIRVGSPVYLKCGTNAAAEHLPLLTPAAVDEMVLQTHRITETIARYCPDVPTSAPGAPDMHLAVVS